ncbi:dienelactone hydrolase family protein [Aggregicoccus sp. 17bor-14]|uniref:dienelactone hydrolase family protein n=1 Tax=Myxococcaceae TaxID=31 RepID=UPI00129D064F|nr:MULTISPECIES: dienelactone hydrolase family protein [Myxococcaceae]MBF5044630.1 dienelactone hydrolase family protein [Simulacricoccus sp. 17bor-14]MRI90374.1 dienelactone hydrolase family protein [Aggregicoccus sp. 17bor-14]
MSTERTELDIKTADGTAHAWLYRGGAGARPAAILYPDAFGVRPATHAMAERLAGLGYVVLLPHIFYRAGDFPPFATDAFSHPPERARLMALIHSITPERIRMDSAAYLDALAAQPRVRADRVGLTGYCMGGRMAFLTAAMHPERVRAAAAFHPGGLVTDAPESPHRLAGQVKAALYLGAADEDQGFSSEHQAALAQALGAAHVDYCLELYRGKRHGYAMADTAVYDADADARHWRRLTALFAEQLG